MIRSIGFDIVDVARINGSVSNPRFLLRIFTERERRQDLSPQRVAGRWAAKEAVAKCIGLHLKWHDVEIRNDETGRPTVHLRPDLHLPAHRRIHVSISHEKEYAAAVAILEDVSDSSEASME